MPTFTASNSLDVVGSHVITGGLSIGSSIEQNYGLNITQALADTSSLTSFSVSTQGMSLVPGITISTSTVNIASTITNLSIGSISTMYAGITSISSSRSNVTLTKASSFEISGVPTLAGTVANFAAFTSAYGLKISSSSTYAATAYGAYIDAPTGTGTRWALYIGSGDSSLGNITGGSWLATAVGVNYGGTGQTATPSNGQLLIGTGSGFQLTTLTAGTNITITNTSGNITIASSGSGGGSGTTTNSLTIGTGLSGGSFNGSSAVTIALANTAVTAGYYTSANITIDAQGRITGAANGSSGGGGSSTYTKTCNFVGPISVQNGTLRWYPDQSVTVTSVYINVSTAQTSGPFSIAVKKNGATIATASLSAGSYTSSVTAVNVAFTSSDYVTIDVTASNGAADAAVILLYTRA